MNEIELLHFGDECTPHIIINDILKQRKKTLFMLGHYSFNDILNYINDNNYEAIYDRQYLKVTAKTSHILHTKYGFILNHDYIYKDGEFINYDFVVERFNLKINNFKESLANNNRLIFLNFANDVRGMKITEMVDTFNRLKTKHY